MPEKITNPVALAIREFYIANIGRFPSKRQCAQYLNDYGIDVPGIGKTYVGVRSAETYLVGVKPAEKP